LSRDQGGKEEKGRKPLEVLGFKMLTFFSWN
jgi:hypothetical protein